MRTTLVCLITSILLTATAAAQTRLYVDQSATGANTGLSWTDAYDSSPGLRNALTYASTDPSVTEIWVADGTYKPAGFGGSRSATFSLANNLAIYGGFAGGETMLSQRNVNTHVSILSGDLNGNDPMTGENSYHVVSAFGANATAVLDGFTIAGGSANGGGVDNRGGGISISSAGPTISNCTISRNFAVSGGGGVNIDSGIATTIFRGCAFDFNDTGGNGGGLAMESTSTSVTVSGCTFHANTATSGGAIHVPNSSAAVFRITNCIFDANQAGNGGAVSSSSGPMTLTNTLFYNNSATSGQGGAIQKPAASLGSITLTNCTLAGNSATTMGGGVYHNSGGFLLIANSIVWGNSDSAGMSGSASQVFYFGGHSVDFSIVQGGWGGNGSNNLSSDPMFFDSANNDYRLLNNSPAIDSGNNGAVLADVGDVDNDSNTVEVTPLALGGVGRFQDDPQVTDTGNGTAPIVDRGAYEFVGDDCNNNGIPDNCDVNCGMVNGPCDVPGCGMSLDCNGNLIPDECDLATGAAMTILPSPSSDNDAFGYGISMANGRALIGAYSREFTTPGEAYIFHREGFNWIQDQQLTASDGSVGDEFGAYVALSQDTAMITAGLADPNGTDSGAVYVFRFDGSNWAETQKLTPSDGAAGFYFGGSLALLGNVVCIGAYDDMVATGAAYIFRFNGATWQEEQKLIPLDLDPGDCFGYVAIGADTVISGSPGDDDNGMNSGAAYVFQYNGATWVQQQKIVPSDPEAGAYFGSYVDISGDIAVIAAPQYGQASPNPGAAYVFRFNGASWVEEQKLVASDGADDDAFGSLAEIDDDFIVVGAPGDSSAGPRTGAAYVYRFNGGTWVELQKLLSPHPSTWDSFGDGGWDIDQQIVLLADFNCDFVNMTCGPGVVYAFRVGETDCNNNSIPDECDIEDCVSDPACGDCNHNLIPDGCDIAFGASDDVDMNGVPDECADFVSGCGGAMSDDWSCFNNWVIPGDVYPDNNMMQTYDVELDMNDDVFLDVDVTIDSLVIKDMAKLRMTQSGALGDLTIATDGGLVIDGNGPMATQLLTRAGRVINLLCGPVTVLDGFYGPDPTAPPGSVNSILNCETLRIGQLRGEVLLEDSMTINASVDLIMDGRGATPCTSDGGKTTPIKRVFDSASVNIDGNFILDGNTNFTNVSAVNMNVGGSFFNTGAIGDCFDCSQGGMNLNGTNAQTFEVSGEDVGASMSGFMHPMGHTNFSWEDIVVTSGATHTVRFQNTVNNGQGNGACMEALYVRNLMFQSGSTITIDNVRVYYLNLVNNGAMINSVGCGQLLPVQIACTMNQQCDDSAACTYDDCHIGFCRFTDVEYGNVNGMGPVTPNLDDILCMLAGFANINNCANGDIRGAATTPCIPNNVISLDDILAVLGAFSGVDLCGCVP